MRVLFGLVLLAAACQGGQRKSDLPAGYADDVHRICNAEQLSGALAEDPSVRWQVVAIYLQRNLVTDEGRKLSAAIFPLAPAAKAEKLAAEAERAGIGACPIAATWRGP